MRLLPFLLAFILMLTVVGTAGILPVPGSYGTIQSAILAAQVGDTVLVDHGRYTENINFLGKNIVVAGRYLLSGDPADIVATIIDGSQPVHPDTASCVLIVSGEGPGAVLEGFTLTGGRGTKWLDEHGAGLFREGGGVLITLSAPTIRSNYIIGNDAVNDAGVVSAGGGGIRVGDGSPLIEGNVILANRGLYGGGIVLNYCSGAVLRNNIISQNIVDELSPGTPTFGGGGVWILERKPGDASANILENNTIVGNLAFGPATSSTAGRGGGLVVSTATVTVRNTIVWNNHQTLGGQINGAPNVSYSCVQGGASGTGNIDAFPLFADTALLLGSGSPCIDAGDPSAPFEDPGNAGLASFPSQGGVRNDMGAYGGPTRLIPGPFSRPGLFAGTAQKAGLDFGLHLAGEVVIVQLPIDNLGSAAVELQSVQVIHDNGATVSVSTALPLQVSPGAHAELELRWAPTATLELSDTLLITHTALGVPSPLPIALRGSTIPVASTSLPTATIFLGNIEASTAQLDTTFMVVNAGTAPDSLYVSIDPRGVTPASALAVAPLAVVVPARDSIELTFTLYPSQVVVTGLGIYSPKIIVASQFSPGAPRFERSVNFRIVGTAGVGEPPDELPGRLQLGQNYPNPFNPSTTIEFTIPAATEVDLTVFDALGNTIDHLVYGRMGAGTHRIVWDARGRASGEYFCRLNAGGEIRVRRLLLLR